MRNYCFTTRYINELDRHIRDGLNQEKSHSTIHPFIHSFIHSFSHSIHALNNAHSTQQQQPMHTPTVLTSMHQYTHTCHVRRARLTWRPGAPCQARTPDMASGAPCQSRTPDMAPNDTIDRSTIPAAEHMQRLQQQRQH